MSDGLQPVLVDLIEELAVLGQLFTQYINSETSPVVAQGLSTVQNDNRSISWLSEGVQALRLDVPFKSPSPINPIQSIDLNIGGLSLMFSEAQPWAPIANSRHSVQASMRLSSLIYRRPCHLMFI